MISEMLKKVKVHKYIKWGIVLLGAGFFCSIAVYFIYPDVSWMKKHNPKYTAFMEYRMEEWRDKGKKVKIRQRWVPLRRVSPYVTKAIIIAEDDKFWSHEGFDFEAMQKAIEKDLKKKKFKAGGARSASNWPRTSICRLQKILYVSSGRPF